MHSGSPAWRENVGMEGWRRVLQEAAAAAEERMGRAGQGRTGQGSARQSNGHVFALLLVPLTTLPPVGWMGRTVPTLRGAKLSPGS